MLSKAMNILKKFEILGLCLVCFTGCKKSDLVIVPGRDRAFISNRNISISSNSPKSQIISLANEFVRGSGLNWGEPEEVTWQDHSVPPGPGFERSPFWKPLTRWIVIYPTPASDRVVGGSRGVFVETNGLIWFVPGG